MIKSNIHTHSVFSDGHDTPEEMILCAIEKGFDTIGFSDHSYTPFDLSYCMKLEDYDEYRRTVNELKEKYSGRIEVLCGTEFDLFSPKELLQGFDYFIASVHYVYAGGNYYSVDHCVETTLQGINEGCGGDENKYVSTYFDAVAQCAGLSPLYVCHFDLPSKYGVIDETTDHYRRSALEALDALLDKNIPIEMNTGAIARGLKTEPYPAGFLLKRIAERKGAVVLGSDCHNKNNLTCAFDAAVELAVKAGVKDILEFSGGRFRNIV